MRNIISGVVVLLLMGGALQAQFKSIHGSFTFQPLYQRWLIEGEDGTQTDVNQFSTLFDVGYKYDDRLKFNLTGAYANVYGDVSQIQSITDMNLSGTFHVPSIGTIFMLKINLPTGNNSLSLDDYQSTATVIGNPVLGFRVPSFGQGLNISPGFVWAYPINERLGVGLGASWQFNGTFQPIDQAGAIDVSNFNPGNEILLTGGVDFRITDAGTISGDIVLNRFEQDRLGSDEVFKAGQRVIATLQFQQYFSFNQLRVLMRYQSQDKNQVILFDFENATVPNILQLGASFRARFSPFFWCTFSMDTRSFNDIDQAFSDGSILSFGISPLIRVTSKISIPIYTRLQTGTFNFGEKTTVQGLDAGIGIQTRF